MGVKEERVGVECMRDTDLRRLTRGTGGLKHERRRDVIFSSLLGCLSSSVRLRRGTTCHGRRRTGNSYKFRLQGVH